MKKSDLKTGMRVEIRCGDVFLVLKDIESVKYGHQEVAFVSKRGFMDGSSYNEDLIYTKNSDYDIVKVYTIARCDGVSGLLNSDTLDLNMRHLIWEREEVKELTVEEISEKLGYEVKIVK